MLIEWTDRNRERDVRRHGARTAAAAAARCRIHPLGEMTFNPTAGPAIPTGASCISAPATRARRAARQPPAEPAAARHARRQDPAHRPRPRASTRPRARSARTGAIGSRTTIRSSPSRARARRSGRYGLRNPHRLIWDVDPAQPRDADACSRSTSGSSPGRRSSSSTRARTTAIRCVKARRAMSSSNGMGPVPDGRHHPGADLGHGHARHGQADLPGDRSTRTPGQRRRRDRRRLRLPRHADPGAQGKLVFGDITTGRIWYAESRRRARGRRRQPDDGRADSRDGRRPAPAREETFRARGGKGEALPGVAAVSGRGRVDLRFADDNDGELYILTKSDGMIRKVVGAETRDGSRHPP